MQAASSGSRVRAARLYLGLGAIGAVALVWWMTSSGDSNTPSLEPKPAPGLAAVDGTGPSPSKAPAARMLEVMVEGCRGPAADTLVFVKVGEELVSGTTDPHGKVRIGTAMGRAEVKAKVAGWEGVTVIGDSDTTVLVRSCRGGEVKGHIIYSGGTTPAVEVPVRLVDGAGNLIDEVLSDNEGAYRVIDPELTAAMVLVGPEDEEPVEEELTPLRPGEVRELDVVLGPTFELVGWVVDLKGDPLSGVMVSIAAEGAGVSWRAMTESGGGFRFPRAPQQPLRLNADGGDLGAVSRRVIPYSERRIDVTLVLEPTGAVLVLTPPDLKGQVVLQSWSSATVNNFVEPTAEEYYPPAGSDEAVADMDSQMERMQGALTQALMAYDEADPAAGMVGILMGMREAMPEIEQTLRAELGQKFPGSEDKGFEELAKLAIDKALEEEPELPKVFAVAARKAREGVSGLEAMMAASQEIEAERKAEEPVPPTELDPEAPIEAPMVDGEPPLEGPYDEAMTVETEYPQPMVAEEAYEAPPDSPLLVRLKEVLGDTVFPYYADDSGVVGRGAVGTEIRVPGAFRYSVLVILDETDPDGQRYAFPCGEVLVPAGRTIEMYCGRETEAAITGTVVDVRGRPIEGARVTLDEVTETTTDHFGEYALTWTGRVANPCAVRVALETANEAWRPSERVNLQCVPGGTLEVAPIVLRREEEAPLLAPSEPFGGVGGALESGFEGVLISSVTPDGPLALDGIDGNSTILKVDDEDATSWPVEEMLARLRGDVGSVVQLQVRGPDGELIETVIERGLITPQ